MDAELIMTVKQMQDHDAWLGMRKWSRKSASH